MNLLLADAAMRLQVLLTMTFQEDGMIIERLLYHDLAPDMPKLPGDTLAHIYPVREEVEDEWERLQPEGLEE